MIDIRGEPCGMPVLRVEGVMKDGRPFAVLVDQEQTLDQLRLLALHQGWTCEVFRDGRDWRAEFTPGTGA